MKFTLARFQFYAKLGWDLVLITSPVSAISAFGHFRFGRFGFCSLQRPSTFTKKLRKILGPSEISV